MPLQGLEPHSVFHYFQVISSIPRGSGYEKEASDFLYDFGKNLGFETTQDEHFNVVIKKPASEGHEMAPVVMLQNHIDMVCEKFPDIEFNFKSDALNLVSDDRIVRADGTSLGADNGIGLAVSLAILDDDTLTHPPLEIVFTTGEEIGLLGASAMDMSELKAKYVINSDSYSIDMVQAGCAGCVYSIAELPLIWERKEELDVTLKITVGGLIGGHSGLDTCKQRSNANKIMGRFLDYLAINKIDFSIVDFKCENMDNAIARDAYCVVALREEEKFQAETKLHKLFNDMKLELSVTDPGFTLYLEWFPAAEQVINQACTEKIIHYLALVPDGMFKKNYHYNDPDLAESSSNLGRIILTSQSIKFRSMIRANFESRKQEVIRKMQILTDYLGMVHTLSADSPVWKFNEESQLIKILHMSCDDLFGKRMRVAVAHGTCECGIIQNKTGADIISIGPTIRNLHSPTEEVDIESVKNLYDVNVRMLELLAQLTDEER